MAFLEADAAAPGALRARLLAAACLERAGFPFDALEELLELDGDGRSFWYLESYQRFGAWRAFDAFARAEVSPEEAGSALQRMAPSEALRPASMQGGAARPESETLHDVDAWRRWFLDARPGLVGHDGRWIWDRSLL